MDADPAKIRTKGILHLLPHAGIERPPGAARPRNGELNRGVNLCFFFAFPSQREQPLHAAIAKAILELEYATRNGGASPGIFRR
jgi:hypothetical protein